MSGWRTLGGDKIKVDLPFKVEEILLKEKEKGSKLKVCIGTDSQVRGSIIQFATVIVFLREGKGGFMLIHSEKEENNIQLKERMIKEVTKSIEVAYSLSSVFDKYNTKLEVHADINTNPEFKSNVAFSEAMGYIKGMGYTFKAKPDAFASSSCADKIL